MSDQGNLILFRLPPDDNTVNLYKFLSFLGFNDKPSKSSNKMKFILETKSFPEILQHYNEHFLMLSNYTDRGLVVCAPPDEDQDRSNELSVMIPFSNIISIYKHIYD